MVDSSIEQAVQASILLARTAIDEHGVSEPALQRIQQILREVAAQPGLLHEEGLKGLHSSGAAATILASEGADGITLMLASFPPEQATPIHDHGSWGVALVLAGQDRYIHWQRSDDGTVPEQAKLEVAYDRILQVGDSVYWFGPPHDIHSQQGHDGETAWELVMFGHDPLQIDRHYFDVESGAVTTAKPY